MLRVLIVAAVLALSSLSAARGQSMQAVTTPPGPGLKVVVTWPASASVTRFNLFRTPSASSAPLNTAGPIARLTSCPAIQALLPPGSTDWTMLSDGLATGSTQFDPCAISTIARNSPTEERLQFLARASWRIAVAAGQAYVDNAIVSGVSYTYELHGVNALGNDIGPVFAPVTVTAGSPVLIPPPGGVSAAAGDSRVLLLWGNQPQAAGFVVQRSTAAAGPFMQVNSSTLVTQVTSGVDGKPLATPSNGFLDIQRWSPNGAPDTHNVNGLAVAGPADGTTYYYRIVSIDILGQQGPPSNTVSATPVDTTPPATPSGVAVAPLEPQSQIEIRWATAAVDVEGHLDSSGIAGYNVFRYESENAPLSSGTQIGGTVPQPPPGANYTVALDNSTNLRPQYGEKTWWYRVEAIDGSGNISTLSAAIGGHLKDITPPAPPKGVAAEGFDSYIEITWDPNTEPDLDHYQVYRSYCHNGKCNPCDPTSQGRPAGEGNLADKGTPCTGQYILVGTVSLSQAMAMGTPVRFRDDTIPAGSPVCYSYWIKAYDHAQNMSGNWPFPAPDEHTVCQRLRDKTPPDPAIISGLFARDGAIRIEWVGPPVQDIRAYHVYRSEKQNGTYQWVGGMTVEVLPTPPHILTAPYKPPPLVGCDTIPLIVIDAMSTGYFVDTHIDAKKFYWYKVVGIDQSGNEAPLAKAAPMSTFTYSAEQPQTPLITSITGTSAAPFELQVNWTPAFDPATTRGFAVFRSDQIGGLYRQVGTLLTASQYNDPLVVKGVTYWYKIVRMDLTGQVSLPSAAVSGTLSP